MKRNDMHTLHIRTVISAICILHNLCEIHGESFNDRWLEGNEYEQPATASLPIRSESARDTRNTLMQYFQTHSNIFFLKTLITFGKIVNSHHAEHCLLCLWHKKSSYKEAL